MELFLKTLLQDLSRIKKVELGTIADKHLSQFVNSLSEEKKLKMNKIIQYFKAFEQEHQQVINKMLYQYGSEENFPVGSSKCLTMFMSRKLLLEDILNIEVWAAKYKDFINKVIELKDDELFIEAFLKKVEKTPVVEIDRKINLDDHVLFQIESEKIKKYFTALNLIEEKLIVLEDDLFGDENEEKNQGESKEKDQSESKEKDKAYLKGISALIDKLFFFFEMLLCYEIDQRQDTMLSSSLKLFDIKENWTLVTSNEGFGEDFLAQA